MKLIDCKRIVVPVIVLVSCSLAGCYTILKHPKTGELAEESDFTRCSDCHQTPPYPPFPPDPRYPPPWWYGPVVVDSQRPIHQRELERPGDWDPIKKPPGIKPPPGVRPIEPPPTPPTGGDGGSAAKDVKDSNGSDDSRPVHQREPEKGNNDSQQSGSKDKR